MRAIRSVFLNVCLLLLPVIIECSPKQCVYLVTMVTSDIRWAGTDDGIYIELYNASTKTGWISLDTDFDDFEQGHSDEFLIMTTCFDNHACLGIYHNKNPTCVGNWWHCEHTSVTLLSLSGSHIGKEHEHYIWKNAYPCEGWYNCKQTFCCKGCRFRLSNE
ncbi:hypothetical protein LSAT2_033060 [Lamellibrachia satsuma]|nr:hypothetical protein LSAT2_033060 [Lamellibrachia satsuma]